MKISIKVLLFNILLICSYDSYCQDLNLQELVELQSKNLDYINSFLSKKGWDFHESEVLTDETFLDYKAVAWSYKINSYNEKAQAWFRLFQLLGNQNAIQYQTNKTHYEELKRAAMSRANSLGAKVSANSLTTTYKRGNITLEFKVSVKEKEDREYDEDRSYYTISVFNHVERDRRIQEIEAEREAQRLAEEQKVIEQQRIAEQNRITEKIRLEEEIANKKRIALEKQLKEEEEQRKQEQIQKEIALKRREELIRERAVKTYNYKDFNLVDYDDIQKGLISSIEDLLGNEKNRPVKGSFKYIYFIDTLGQTNYKTNSDNIDNKGVVSQLISVGKSYHLSPIYKDDFTLNAKAEYNINIRSEFKTFKLSKKKGEINFDKSNMLYKDEIINLLYQMPDGKFKISLHPLIINNVSYSKNKIINYKNIDGPIHALKSFIIPGLGDGSVSNGQRKGWGIFSLFVASAGFGLLSDYLSEVNYKKYHESRTQTEINDYYTNANFYNQTKFLFFGIGASIWLYDIVWVLDKGIKNNKKAKTTKQNYK